MRWLASSSSNSSLAILLTKHFPEAAAVRSPFRKRTVPLESYALEICRHNRCPCGVRAGALRVFHNLGLID